MAQINPLNWSKEPSQNYLNNHLLYRGIKDNLWKYFKTLNSISPNFFIRKEAIKGLSMDWSKYATPNDTLNHLIPL